MPIIIQGHEFCLDFFVLPIKRPEAVLGIQWLQRLRHPWLQCPGRVSIDYLEMTIEFFWEGKQVILQGDPIQLLNMISFHQFHTLIYSEGVDSLFELYSFSSNTSESHIPNSTSSTIEIDLPSSLPESIYLLLHKYKVVFTPPTSLPPQRNIDHKIHLTPNCKPVNVKPYRYPQF